MKKTKIVCTIGPKTESKELLYKLINAGMNIMRLNFSHGNYKEHNKRIKNLRTIIKNTNHQIAILLDTQGPEIRTMKLKNNTDVQLYTGQKFIFTTTKKNIGNNQCVAVNYENFAKDLSVGNKILVDDGLITMIVTDIKDNNVFCKVQNNGILGENKSINLPNIKISLPTLAEKDKKDLIFGIKNKVDFIAASFIRKHTDVLEIRKYLNQHNGEHIQIISKIENQEGLDNFDKILEVSDGIMIARGDLGVEIPIEEVIFAQKMIINKCNFANKAVITATQMLDSMIKNPRPTRAEAGDVTNAILDGTDAVMLSGETAKGKYPIIAVNIMSNICKRTDNILHNRIYQLHNNDYNYQLHINDTICKSAVEIAEKLQSPLILVATKQGKSAKTIRKYFPKAMILALTTNPFVVRQLILIKGVICKLINKIKSTSDFYQIGNTIALKTGLAKPGDIIVTVSGSLIPSNNNINNTSIYIL